MTSIVRLRQVIDADLPVFHQHQADPVATRMAAFPSRDWDAFSAHWTKIRANENAILRTILFDAQVAGNIVSWLESGQREIGYWIGKDYWGKGIATQALSAFLAEVTTRPLYAHVAKHNVASIRVLEKNGFVIMGDGKSSIGTSGDVVEEFLLKLSAGKRLDGGMDGPSG